MPCGSRTLAGGENGGVSLGGDQGARGAVERWERGWGIVSGEEVARLDRGVPPELTRHREDGDTEANLGRAEELIQLSQLRKSLLAGEREPGAVAGRLRRPSATHPVDVAEQQDRRARQDDGKLCASEQWTPELIGDYWAKKRMQRKRCERSCFARLVFGLRGRWGRCGRRGGRGGHGRGPPVAPPVAPRCRQPRTPELRPPSALGWLCRRNGWMRGGNACAGAQARGREARTGK